MRSARVGARPERSVNAGEAPIQRKAEPDREQPASIDAGEDWTDVVFRPDLYQEPRSSDAEQSPDDVEVPAAGGGSPLPGPVQAKMEHALGADFSAVRVHQDDRAEALGAEAFTRGTDIHFAPGRYDPGSPSGQELIGHELVHVVQQADGRVQDTTQAKGASVNDDASLEREADVQGARAARGEVAGARRSAGAGGRTSSVIQCGHKNDKKKRRNKGRGRNKRGNKGRGRNKETAEQRSARLKKQEESRKKQRATARKKYQDEIIRDPGAWVEKCQDWIEKKTPEGVWLSNPEKEQALEPLRDLVQQLEQEEDDKKKRRLADSFSDARKAAQNLALGFIEPKVAEKERRGGIAKLRDDWLSSDELRSTAVNRICDECRDGEDTVEQTRQKLFDALNLQRQPSIEQWLRYLHLGVNDPDYIPDGDFLGCRIHRTHSNDAVRQPGRVDKHSAEQLMANLFAGVDTNLQNHVSLEVPGRNAHVYWNGTSERGNYGGDWPAAEQKLRRRLEAWKQELLPKFEEAKTRQGRI